MDLSIRQGVFTSLSSQPGAESCLLMFESGRPVLHLDMASHEWMPLLQKGSIEGWTREGSDFTGVLDGSFSTNGRTTIALDDLLVAHPFEKSDEVFDSDRIRVIDIAFDPQAVGGFFAGSHQSLNPLRVDELTGRRIDELVGLHDPVTVVREDSSMTLTLTAGFSPSASAIDGFSGRHRTRLYLQLESHPAVGLRAARQEVAALLCLIDAVGRPQGNYLREVRLTSSGPEVSPPAARDWWSKSLMGMRDSSVAWSTDPLRSGGISSGEGRATADLEELGGLSALTKWIALCDRVPHILSVLDAQHHSFVIDARASMLSLAVGWEHLAEASRNAARDEAWREISELLAPERGGDGSFEKMIELCWNTYLEIKHVRLRKRSRNSIPAEDGHALGVASEFMYCTVLSAAFTLAEIPVPSALLGRIRAHPESGWVPEWHWVVDRYPPTTPS